MPQNGEINDKFGTYKSLCCGAEIVINSGARFPDCPRHLNLPTIWKAIAEEKIEEKLEEKVDEKVVTPIRNGPAATHRRSLAAWISSTQPATVASSRTTSSWLPSMRTPGRVTQGP